MKIVADHVEEDAEVSELITRLEAAADQELAAGTGTIRWGREQIGIIKRAAALMGCRIRRTSSRSCSGRL